MSGKEADIRQLKIDVGFIRPGQRGKIETKRVFFLSVVDQLKKPQKIKSITLGQYYRLSQDEQNRIKDVGSIVFGKFKDVLRRNDNLEYRTAISLDVDDLTTEQFKRFMEGDTPLQRWVYFAHTTLKHSIEKPRLRIYIPTSREVEPHEYMPLSRIVASFLFDDEEESMDACDNVSFRPAQVAYLPGQLNMSDFEWSENLDAALCDPDEVFDEFDGDWMDIAQLPVSEKRGHGVLARAKRAEDPWEKKGVIGAFCRTYHVEDAIKRFLPDVYIPSEEHWSDKPRYTYAKGTGTNGVVVEDDGRFIYSHHSSDPCGERLVNSWDMVRMHLFGEKDAGIGEDVSPSKRPSFKAMEELALDERPVRSEMARTNLDFDDIRTEDEKQADGRRVLQKTPIEPVARWVKPKGDDVPAEADPVLEGEVDLDVMGRASDLPIGIERVNDDWTSDLDVDKTGAINATAYNLALIAANDPRFKGKVGYNELMHTVVLLENFSGGFPGASKFNLTNAEDGDAWTDAHTFQAAAMLSAPKGKGYRGYDLTFAGGAIYSALTASAMHRSFHPIRQKFARNYDAWMASKRTKRVETLFIDYLGCEDNIYTREVSRNFLIGMVARVFEPGCKFDFVPVLQGGQGARKTTFLSVLGYGKWHTEFRADLTDPKLLAEGIKGFLVVELGELASIRKSDVEPVKAALSVTHDTYRAPYARLPETTARCCVFAGTTNNETFLRDTTGSRRFWTIKVKKTMADPIDTDKLVADRDLIIGEAVALYLERRAKGKVHLDLSPEAVKIAEGVAQEVMETSNEDIIMPRVLEYLEQEMRASLAFESGGVGDFDNLDEPEGNVVRTRVTIGEVYQHLYGRFSNPNTASTNVLANALMLVPGWVRYNNWVDPKTGIHGPKSGRMNVGGGKVLPVYVREGATYEEIRDGFRPIKPRWDDGGEDLI